MTFWNDIGDFFKNDVYGGFLKPVGEGVWNEAIKPVWNTVVKPVAGDVYQGVAKPLIDTTGGLVKTGGKLVDKSTDNFLNLQGIVSSPLFLIGAGILAIIIVPKVLDKYA